MSKLLKLNDGLFASLSKCDMKKVFGGESRTVCASGTDPNRLYPCGDNITTTQYDDGYEKTTIDEVKCPVV